MCQNDATMTKKTRHRRPLIEALEPRLLFSATTDIAVFDDGNSEGQYLARAAQETDLVSIYRSADWASFEPFMQAAQPEPAQGNKTVIFVDTAVENYQTLVKDIHATHGDQVTVIYLDARQDGVAQISNHLATMQDVAAIHIISHGVAGNLQLGMQVLDAENISEYRESLQQWKSALTQNADVLLYGCDLAASPQGINFLRQFSEFTGADVAASNDLTGTEKNADWELEESIGNVETASIFTSSQSLEWQGVLADVVHLYSGVATNEQAIPVGGDIKQGVQLTASKNIDRIQVMLANHGSSASSVQLFVHQSSHNGPVVASASVNAASLGNSLAWVNFDFAQTTFNAYTVYWVEIKTDSGADNLIGVGYVNSNVITSEFVVNGSSDASRDMAIALIDVENQPPVLANAIPNQTATEESAFTYTVPANTFSDPDGDALTYSATLANGNPLPSWLTFNANTRTFNGVPDDPAVGTLSLRVTATDGKGGSVSDNFDVTINNINDAPVLNTPVPHQNATEDSFFSYTFPANTFTDADAGASLSYTAELAGGGSLPAWLSFNSATRTFSGTPTNNDVGTISIKITASDGLGGIANDIFDITVANINEAPVVVTPILDQTATENVLFNYTFPVNTFRDPDAGDSLTYTTTLSNGSALPAWLTFDSATRTFSGTPLNTDIGTISIRITASDGVTSVSDTFDLLVKNAETISAIIDTSGSTIHTQIFSPGQPIFQSFTNTFGGGTYNIDSIILQLQKSASAATQTITVSLIADNLANSPLISRSISSDELTTSLNWKAFNFSGTSLNDSTIYYIKVETDGTDGAVAIGIHNSNRYPDGMLYYAAGNPAPDRDLAFQITSGADTDPVIMHPIPNQTATEDSAFSFQFSDTAFYDPDGDSLTYTATLDNGNPLPAWLSFDPATRTFSGTPVNADVGTLSITVRASDPNGGVYATDTFDITVTNVNDNPVVADPIPAQTAIEDLPFNFTFATNTFFDEDAADSLTYSAQLTDGGALPAWLSFDAVTRTFRGTPTNDDVGVLSVRVIANDGNGGVVANDFTITIGNTNDAPRVVTPIPDQFATEDVAFSFQFSGSAFADDDLGDVLVYSAQLAGGGALPAWLSFNAATRTFSGTPTNNDVGNFSVAVTARDNNGGVVTDVFAITVANVNDAPVINVSATNYSVGEQALLNLHGTGITVTDVDSTLITLTINATATGSEVSATAGSTGINVVSGNGTDTLVISGDLAQLNQFLSGANGGALTYRVNNDTPATTSNLTFTVNDGALSATDTATVTINAVNDAPSNSVPPVQTTDEDTPLVFSSTNGNQIQIADVDAAGAGIQVSLSVTNGTLTLAGTTGLLFSVGDGSSDANITFTGSIADINAALATLTYIPANNFNGTATLSITTSDLGNAGSGGAQIDTDTVSITVNALNDLPVVANAIADQNAVEDSPFSFQIPANAFADSDGDTLTYSAQLYGGGALPAWLNFNSATRAFSGTPANADVGIISIAVTADDGNGGTITDTFDIVVTNTNDAPTVANPIADQNAVEDSPFSFQIPSNAFADADGDTLTYSAQLSGGGALPAWLNFNSATRTFSGTPANADVGIISIAVTADDGNGGTITDTFDIVVTNTNDSPTVANPIADQNAVEDSPFSFQIPSNAFADIDGDTLTYSAQLSGGGALPAWLNFDTATRTFSGTPLNQNVGTLSIEVIVNDGNGGTITDTFNIVVANTNDAPTVANPIANQNAVEDSPFSFQIPANAFADADGDTLTYSAQLSGGGALPAWLNFDVATRTFSGTPLNQDLGELSVEVVAADGQAVASAQFVIRILPVNDAPVALTPAPIATVEDSSGDSLDLFSIFSDEETPVNELRYTVVGNSNPSLVSNAIVDTATGKLLFSYGVNQFGQSDITVRAQDESGAFVETTFRINVAAVNDTPVSRSISDVLAEAGAAPLQMNLQEVFFDVEDGQSLSYSVISNTNQAVVPSVYWDSEAGVMRITFASATGGETVITLRAQDSDGAWVDTQFKVSVTPPGFTPVQPESPASPNIPPIFFPDTGAPVPPVSEQASGAAPVPTPVIQPTAEIPQLALSSEAATAIAETTDGFALPDDKSSRDYERMEAQLHGQKLAVAPLAGSTALTELITADGLAPWDAAEFDNEVRRIRAQMDDAMKTEQHRREIVAGITFSITTGFLIWSLRASSLLLALMSMLPLWRGFDPLPILDEVNKRKKELEQQRKDRAHEDKDSKEVGYLFDHAQRKRPEQ